MAQLDLMFPTETVKRLESLRARTGRTSVMEVIRDAMDLYDNVIVLMESGDRLWVGKSKEDTIEIDAPTFRVARALKSPPIAK